MRYLTSRRSADQLQNQLIEVTSLMFMAGRPNEGSWIPRPIWCSTAGVGGDRGFGPNFSAPSQRDGRTEGHPCSGVKSI